MKYFSFSKAKDVIPHWLLHLTVLLVIKQLFSEQNENETRLNQSFLLDTVLGNDSVYHHEGRIFLLAEYIQNQANFI